MRKLVFQIEIDSGMNDTEARLALDTMAGTLSGSVTDKFWLDRGTPAPKPSPSPRTDVTFEILERRYPISSYIYGTQLYQLHDTFSPWSTCGRMGGNNWTPYNWKNNATNAGVDYHHFNSSFLGGGDVPGQAMIGRVDKILAAGARPIIQVPMSDYVAADTRDGDVGESPDYLNTRFRKNFPWGNGEAIYQSEMLTMLLRKYGFDKLFFSLDNEPDSWRQTHPRIFAQSATYSSYLARIKEYSHLVRELAGGGAAIFAPSLTGYMGFHSFGQATDANNRNFASYFLEQMKLHSDAQGKRMLDVFDIHWYPEHRGTNNIRVTEDDAEPETARARVEAPRSLWDNSFTENSWITNDVIKRPIALLPDLQNRIDNAFPGTRIGITEYYYGGGDHISGAIAQADVLGIFGRHGVFAANLWRWSARSTDKFIFAAFRCFRDFDGAGAKFGDIGMMATSSDSAMTSIYADEIGTVILINKHTTPKTAFVKGANGKGARSYVLAGDAPAIVAGAPVQAEESGFVYVMPAMSVSVIKS